MAIVALGTLASRQAQAGESVAKELLIIENAIASGDPTLRAAAAELFVALFGADPSWARGNVQRIFGSGTEDSDVAVWHSYLRTANVYARTYDVLWPVYQAHLNELDSDPRDTDTRDVLKVMIAHLWVLYANGIEDVDVPDSLIARFLAAGSDYFVGRFLYVIGEDLIHGNLPDTMLNRAKVMLDRVRAFVTEGRRSATVLQGFGSWVSAAGLSAEWRLSALEAVLRATKGSINDEHRVVEGLAAMAAVEPAGAVRCVRLLVEAVGSYAPVAVSQFAEPVFIAAIAAGGQALKDAQVANTVLVDNGMYQFQDLFTRARPSS